MLILSSTTDKIEAVTSTAASIDRALFYTKLNLASTPVVDDAQVVSGNIAAASTVSLSGFPASSTDRWAIVAISLRNKDATLSCVVTVRHVKAAGTAVELYSCTLLPGEEVKMDKNGVWFHYDANGGVYGAVAAAMKRTVLTSGTAATYNTPPGCRAIDVECYAGAGAGGSSAGAASSAGAGAGGGSGGYTRKLFSPPSATYTYTVGAAGAAGATGNVAGGNGGDTTFGTLTAKGGAGGPGSGAAAATALIVAGGAGGVAGSGGDINAPGEPGLPSNRVSATVAQSGGGGASVLGAGANGLIAQAGGNAAVANTGAGGGGALSLNTATSLAGGGGGSGVIIVTEFY